ncbi:MAG TPA: DNA (cytosine-5-)-methyltransferase [Thermoanaerobaculia bacterium]
MALHERSNSSKNSAVCRKGLPIPVVSLFSGPGGLDLGFQEAGFETVLALDYSAVAVETFNKNLPPVAKTADLAKASDKDVVDLVAATGKTPAGVIGGPPCQGFSLANVRQLRVDPRRQLTFRFAELVGALDAAFGIDFFLMENVAALSMPKQHRLFQRLRRKFESLGFTIYVTVANAWDFGVAQNRPRLFVTGIKRNLARFAQFEFPKPTAATRPTVREVIGHLPAPIFFDRRLTPEMIPYHPNHWTMVPKSAKFREGLSKGGRSFKRLEWSGQSPAVAYGHRELHVHPTGTRRVSLLEAMLLQGFLESCTFAGNLSEQVTQVSDAVPPPLAAALAGSIHTALYERRATVQRILIDYYRAAGRTALPWRRTKDPFEILVAEKLLQQTAVRQGVVDAYQSLLERWPSPDALADAAVEEVRAMLQPLGLPYRASELVTMSQVLVRQHQGIVPLTRRDLLALPGVGEYAANAVLSFTDRQETAVVDTNVSRLLRRLFGLEEAAPANPARSRTLYSLASWLIAGMPSKILNYAVLDLTAELCTARKPRCQECALRSFCVAVSAEPGGDPPRAYV